MSHVRKQVRDYFETTLTGLTTTGTKVYASRVYSLAENNLPAIAIYTKSETSAEVSFVGKRVQNRVLDVAVEGYVRTTATFDDVIDTIATEVETALLADTTLGGLAINTELTSTEINFSGESEQPVGTIVLTFAVQYRTETGQPETAI